MLSYNLWHGRFGAARSVLGATITINAMGLRRAYTVAGVMPQGFSAPYPLLPDRTDVWIPLKLPLAPTKIGDHAILTIGLLSGRATRTQISARAATVTSALRHRFGSQYSDSVRILLAKDWLTSRARSLIVPVLLAMILSVGIACVNLMLIFLAWGSRRTREYAVRVALGATPIRLAAQSAAEAAILSLPATLFGAALAAWAVRTIAAMTPTAEYIPRMRQAVFSNAALLPLGACVLFFLSLAVAASMASTRVGRPRRIAAWPGPLRWAGPLVGIEAALTLSLIAAAGLLAKSVLARHAADERTHPSGLVLADIRFTNVVSPHLRAAYRRLRTVEERLAALPGAERVALADSFPLDTFTFLFHAPANTAQPAELHVVGPAFFRLAGFHLVRGHALGESRRQSGPFPAVVNTGAARELFGAIDAVGRAFTTERETILADEPVRLVVVGVADEPPRFGSGASPAPAVYVPAAQFPQPVWTLLARTAGAPAPLEAAIRGLLQQVAPGETIVDRVTTANAISSEIDSPQRFAMSQIALLGAAAFLLALIGIYGLAAHHVERRTREIGVRLALGAPLRRLIGGEVWRGLQPAAIGSGAGCVGALILGKLLASLLYRVSWADPATLFFTAAALLTAAGLAAYTAARRVLAIDPAESLRIE